MSSFLRHNIFTEIQIYHYKYTFVAKVTPKSRRRKRVGWNNAKDGVKSDKYGDWRRCPSALSSPFYQTLKKVWRNFWWDPGVDASWQWSLPEAKMTAFSPHFVEPKDKAALFKGYQACLFSSRVGGSFYIVDCRKAAWRNVPVKLPECTALNMEEFPRDQTSHSCHERLLKVLTAFSAWIRWLILRWEWECKIRQKCNRSQMESHCQRALPVGTPRCLDGRSDLKWLWNNILIGRANKTHKELRPEEAEGGWRSCCWTQEFNRSLWDSIV